MPSQPELERKASPAGFGRLQILAVAAIVALIIAAPLRLLARAQQQSPPTRTPILLDTDIGTDIDDAFALALILRSPELNLLGVTTVSGNTEARARLAAKMLCEAKHCDVPVVAGKPGKSLPIEQTHWADNFSSSQLLSMSAADFLAQQFDRKPGEITLVAIGPLTNVAALLQHDPKAAKEIRQIVMMGGSIARGYDHHKAPEPEYNIDQDVAAARVVFSSGVPITMAPLDVTAMLELDAKNRKRIFDAGTPLSKALAALYSLWGHPVPILFDPMAVAMLLQPGICTTKALDITVDAKGFTHVVKGAKPNAVVGLHTDPAKFFHFYLSRVAPPANRKP